MKVEAVATISGVVHSTVDSVEVVLVDRRTTPYGSGWWPSGVMRIVAAGTDAVLVGSDGTASIFRGYLDTYLSPPGNTSTLKSLGTAGWELRFRGGGKVTFDSQGRQTAVIDANSNSTSISYLSTDQINQITDPVGKKFTFAYTSGKLSSISDPGGRQTLFSVGSNRLNTVTPPTPSGKNYSATFNWNTFTGSGALPRYRQDGLGLRDSVKYDANWRPNQAVLPAVPNEAGTSVIPRIYYYAQELKGMGATASLDTTYTKIVDPRNNWTASSVDRWGTVLKTWDALGTIGINTYTAEGFLLSSEGKSGDSSRVWRTYDSLNRLARVYRIRSNGTTLRLDSLVYDANHRVIKRIDPRSSPEFCVKAEEAPRLLTHAAWFTSRFASKLTST